MRCNLGLVLLLLYGCSAPQALTSEAVDAGTIIGMGSPQSPSATPTFPATITPPLDGEALSATTLNTNVETPLQNGVEAARLMSYGGGIRRRVQGVSSTVLTISPLGAVVVTVGGIWTVLPDLTGSASERVISGNLNPTTMTGGFVALTRYWIYASYSGGKIAFTASVDGPDAGMRYKSGNTDYLYVSTFITSAGPGLIKYSQSDNEYTYLGRPLAGGGVANILVLDTTAMVGTTNVPLGYTVPTGTGTAYLDAQLTGGAGPLTTTINGAGLGGPSLTITSLADVIPGHVELSMALGQSFDYTLSAGTGSLSVWVGGFTL